MKKIFLLLFCLAIYLYGGATNLRGQILQGSVNGAKPAANVKVDLYIWNEGQWVNWAYAITDKDGFYYFLNFDKDKTFYIAVNGKFYPPKPLTILDIQPPQYQDVPTVTI